MVLWAAGCCSFSCLEEAAGSYCYSAFAVVADFFAFADVAACFD